MPHSKLLLLHLAIVLIWSAQTTYGQKTIITGKAINAKYGAAVITSGGDLYYIDGLKEWNPDQFERSVKVTGKVKVINMGIGINHSEEIRGGITGPTIKIIKRARFQMLSDRTAFLSRFSIQV